jgi:hypothetical protein
MNTIENSASKTMVLNSGFSRKERIGIKICELDKAFPDYLRETNNYPSTPEEYQEKWSKLQTLIPLTNCSGIIKRLTRKQFKEKLEDLYYLIMKGYFVETSREMITRVNDGMAYGVFNNKQISEVE